MLCLAQRLLVVRVGHVEGRSGQLHVQVEGIDVRRVHVQPVEERLAVAVAVKHFEFRRVEKTVGPHRAHRHEVADLVRSGAEIEIRRRGVERAVAAHQRAARPPLIQPRLGDDAHHQAVLVAEFGGRDSGDHLHRLHGVGRDLVGVDPALLVGHGLVVDGELRLGVIAQRVEEAVGVGDHAR